MHQFKIIYRSAGENIADRYTTQESVMTGWMNSPGNMENILNKGFIEMGIYCIIVIKIIGLRCL